MRIPDKIERALFIQIKQAGDCLLSTPALRAFKKRFPGSGLDYLAGKYSAGILYDNPHIDNLIVMEGDGWGEVLSMMFDLRKRKYDLVVDFLSSPTSSKITFATGAGIRTGYNRRGRRWAYNSFPDTTNPDDYSARDKIRLVEPLGVEPDGLRLDFILPENEIKAAIKDLGHQLNGLLAVVPVSRRPYKRWPESNFARLLDRACRELKLKPLLLCGPGEMGLIENVARGMENQPVMRVRGLLIVVENVPRKRQRPQTYRRRPRETDGNHCRAYQSPQLDRAGQSRTYRRPAETGLPDGVRSEKMQKSEVHNRDIGG
jgi:ADP-heptose:LPS heptosyltransferase